MTLRNIEFTKFFRAIFLSLQGTLLHSLNVIKWEKPNEYKFAFNSIFTILTLASFSLAW